MVWIPKDPEIAAMLSADGKRRYEYFIHRVCDTGKRWGLRESGWASLGDEGGQKLFPLWPHEKYAERFKVGGFEQYHPESIELEVFIDGWLPNMKKAGVALAIFPLPSGESVTVPWDDLQANLRDERSKHS